MVTVWVETNTDGKVIAWAKTNGSPNEVPVEIADDHAFFTGNPFLFSLVDGTLVRTDEVVLNVEKNNKMKELNKACDATICGTFPFTYSDGVEYYFYCDTVAQSNFEKVDRAFDKGRMTEINWTAYDSNGQAVRLLFTADTFEALYLAHLYHIQGTIAHFRDVLEPQVLQAKTVEAVKAVTWENETLPI